MELSELVLKIALTLLFISILMYSGRAIYNVTLHPLAGFPGPTMYGASIVPSYYDLCRGNSASRTLALHEKYGPVVRMTPNDLSFNSSQAWRDIYGYRKGGKHLERDPRFFYADPTRAQNIISSNEANHARLRKVMIHAFSDKALQEQEPIVTSYCDLLIEQLHSQMEAKQTVDIAAWFNFASFDIIGDLTFGESFHALEKGEEHWWMSTIFNGFKMGVLVRTAKEYMTAPFGGWIFSALGNIPGVVKMKEKFRNFIRDNTLSRLSMKIDRRDIMGTIIRHNDKGSISKSELATNAGCLIIAGSESTATLLSGLIFYLHSTPRVLSLLQHEIRQSFASPSAMTFDSLSKLPYLQACIEEALRLYPPIPCGLPRQVPVGGMIIDGHFVPCNTSVSMHQLSTGRSKHNFKDPLTFVPERWLQRAQGIERDTAATLQINEKIRGNNKHNGQYSDDDFEASQPFALGSRGCLGKNLAFAEMRSILARLIWNFDIELQSDSLEWDQQKVYVLWSKAPLNVKLIALERKTICS
ncbi:cytochrome P450 monooxygenase-like protein [Rhexocercosporidium sp. MPI-PUGE-AT-0058]|nr:cytochrome P450 monooxygenase-like protein [Rhexocercosporidium sp. MPI-PUGE-AT-0058]